MTKYENKKEEIYFLDTNGGVYNIFILLIFFNYLIFFLTKRYQKRE